MQKDKFIEIINKFGKKFNCGFKYQLRSYKHICMIGDHTMLIYTSEDEDKNQIYVSFCYDLTPNDVKNLFLKLLVFMDEIGKTFIFVDEFFLTPKGELVFGEQAKNAWKDEMTDEVSYDFSRQKNLDELWYSYSESEFIHC